MWGVSLIHLVLPSFVCRDFLWHIRYCCNFYGRSFSYTSHNSFLFIWGVSLTHPLLASFFIWGVSLTHPVLVLFLSGEISLTHSMLTFFSVRSFSSSSTSHTGFLFWSGKFLLHIPYCLLFFNLGSFSYTSHAGLIFIWGVSLTHPMLTLFLCGEFLLHIPCCLDFYARSFSYTFRVGFFFFSFFYLMNFSYTSHAGLIFF